MRQEGAVIKRGTLFDYCDYGISIVLLPYCSRQSTGKVHFQVSFEIKQDGDKDDEL
jgi:hypothetical protein